MNKKRQKFNTPQNKTFCNAYHNAVRIALRNRQKQLYEQLIVKLNSFTNRSGQMKYWKNITSRDKNHKLPCFKNPDGTLCADTDQAKSNCLADHYSCTTKKLMC